jgi:hypothetical protein
VGAPPQLPVPRTPCVNEPPVNRPDTALHIAVLHHSFYVGAISIWGGAGTTKRSGVIARPDVH